MGMAVLDRPAPLIRLTEARYADGASRLVEGANPLRIAATVFDQSGDMPNAAKLSQLFVIWGQFLDHDMSLSQANTDQFVIIPGMPGPIQRSDFRGGSGPDNPRIQLNAITPEIDGSGVYGSTAEREQELRAFEGGRLRMDGDLRPRALQGQEMEGNFGTMVGEIFLAGDIRANENPALLALHTLFAREHNHWADRLAAENPDWSDDRLFEAARSVVEALIQQISYDEWLPSLFGDGPGAGMAGVSDLLSG